MEKCFLLSISGFAIFLTSCGLMGPENNPEPQNCIPDTTVSNLIMGKEWVVTAETTLTVSGADTTSENTFKIIANCSLDDWLEFKANNILTSDNGDKKCVFFTPQSMDGYWCTTDNGQGITITMNKLTGKAKIMRLSGQETVWRETKPNQPKGKTTIVETTYTAR